MMRRFSVQISEEAWAALSDLAHKQHRRPVDQAAVLLERALLGGDAEAVDDLTTPRLTELRAADEEASA